MIDVSSTRVTSAEVRRNRLVLVAGLAVYFALPLAYFLLIGVSPLSALLAAGVYTFWGALVCVVTSLAFWKRHSLLVTALIFVLILLWAYLRVPIWPDVPRVIYIAVLPFLVGWLLARWVRSGMPEDGAV